ncbi:MAG TPA: Na+/H+ antiporter subunit E [Noviherbaspirillum sp.]|nr:Na+/H+ antiporter subunit E [Noviherbaspirillum sp.]
MSRPAPLHAATGTRPVFGALAWRTLVFAFLWWVLVGGYLGSWYVGVPSIALAVWSSMKLSPPPALRFSPLALLTFFIFFIVQSLKGGVQVAVMALRPTLDLHPAQLDLPLRVSGPAQLVLASAVSLMPGTLAMTVENNRLRLHVLDARLPIARDVRAAERRIARIYGQELAEGDE